MSRNWIKFLGINLPRKAGPSFKGTSTCCHGAVTFLVLAFVLTVNNIYKFAPNV